MDIIFPRIPRTASTAARQLLIRDGHAPVRMRHRKLLEYDAKLCENAFKFTFIRNPYDQIRSFYDLGKSQLIHPYSVEFEKWILDGMPVHGIWLDRDPFDQTEFIRAPDKESGDENWIGLDRVYRYTHLDEAWDDLSKIIGCPKLRINDKSPRMSHRIFTDEMKGLVLSRYSHVFCLLDFDEDTGEDNAALL